MKPDLDAIRRRWVDEEMKDAWSARFYGMRDIPDLLAYIAELEARVQELEAFGGSFKET